jgi:hypothetical protein
MSTQVLTGLDGEPLTVLRGEKSGVDFETFELQKTHSRAGFFFTTCPHLAQSYGASLVRRFHLRARKTLDLREINWLCPETRAVLQTLEDNWDEWIDRYSGEPTSPGRLIEAACLYDYEGTGSGKRWHDLFRCARLHDFDCVRLFDHTDKVSQEEGAPEILVVYQDDQIERIS